MGCPCARKTHPRQSEAAAPSAPAAEQPAGYRHPDRGERWTGPERVDPPAAAPEPAAAD